MKQNRFIRRKQTKSPWQQKYRKITFFYTMLVCPYKSSILTAQLTRYYLTAVIQELAGQCDWSAGWRVKNAQTKMFSLNRASDLVSHLRLRRRLAVCSAVSLQVSAQVGFAGVAFRTVTAGVRANFAVSQHMFLQVELPPQTLSTFWTRVGLLSWRDDEKP